MLTKQQAIDVLKTVCDPELGIDVWTLGLIYEIKIEDEIIRLKMTFTSPMCPYGAVLMDMVHEELMKLKPKKVFIDLVFEPIWQPSEELKAAMGL